MFSNTAYTDYLLGRQLTEDPDMDYTNAEKRKKLLSDMFHQFYRKDTKESTDAPEHIKKIFEHLNNIDDFKYLKSTTIGDKTSSYIASCKFEEEFKNMIRRIESEERKDFDFRDSLEEYIAANPDKFRFKLREIIGKTKEEVEMQDELEGMGIGNATKPGETFKATSDIKKLSKKMLSNSRHRKMIDLLGRFKRMADSNMRTKTTGQEELVGITMGDDLDNLLPEEIAEFMDPDTEVLFLDKFSNKNLLQYDAVSKEPEGRGDVVCVMDESGSMVDCKVDYDNDSIRRIDVARSILFGLACVAKKSNRRLRLIRFDGGAIETTFNSMEEVMMFALEGNVKNGGTSYDNMLTKVMEVMTEERKKKSDVILISDGEACIDPDILKKYTELKQELSFKCVSLMIGDYGYELKKISDLVFNNLTGNDLNANSSAMKSVFGI
jgi:uncharacterized protein with von Willebrand factor type A (vWA) domain